MVIKSNKILFCLLKIKNIVHITLKSQWTSHIHGRNTMAFPSLLYLVIFKHGFQRVRYYHPDAEDGRDDPTLGLCFRL